MSAKRSTKEDSFFDAKVSASLLAGASAVAAATRTGSDTLESWYTPDPTVSVDASVMPALATAIQADHDFGLLCANCRINCRSSSRPVRAKRIADFPTGSTGSD